MTNNPFITAITKPTKDVPEPEKKKKSRGPDDLIQTSFRVTIENHRKLRELAIHDGVSMNDLVVEALRAYCDSRGVRFKRK